jgi:3-methyladenine DNA glycosylase AlkD
MNAPDILTTLKKLGKPQTAAIYKRHGAGENVFGVPISDIARLQKKIKVDHALAMELWKTRNAEARVLALQVADPMNGALISIGVFLHFQVADIQDPRSDTVDTSPETGGV